ncbi:MAG: hypothetical protein ACR2FG_08130 [Marmoricola sp.]
MTYSLDLVEAASTGPPYDYAPGEVAPARDWVPDLVRRGVGSLVARDGCGRLVGYCLDHETAIRLYERCGFHPVPRVRQIQHGRPRLFLLRELEPQ